MPPKFEFSDLPWEVMTFVCKIRMFDGVKSFCDSSFLGATFVFQDPKNTGPDFEANHDNNSQVYITFLANEEIRS